MSNIILLFYTVICCIDYCFAVVIHRLEGEDREVEEEDKEVGGRGQGMGRGWGRGGRSNRNGLVKHVTVVKYYGKNELYNCIVCLCIFNIIIVDNQSVI